MIGYEEKRLLLFLVIKYELKETVAEVRENS
jgi:hypothetical protein